MITFFCLCKKHNLITIILSGFVRMIFTNKKLTANNWLYNFTFLFFSAFFG